MQVKQIQDIFVTKMDKRGLEGTESPMNFQLDEDAYQKMNEFVCLFVWPANLSTLQQPPKNQ